jgi:hypothetical protein
MRRTKETFQSFEDETSRVRASTKQKDPRRVSISLLCDLKRRACRHLNLGMAPQLHEKTLSVGRPGYCGNHVRRHPGARLAAGPDLRCGVFLRNEQ